VPVPVVGGLGGLGASPVGGAGGVGLAPESPPVVGGGGGGGGGLGVAVPPPLVGAVGLTVVPPVGVVVVPPVVVVPGWCFLGATGFAGCDGGAGLPAADPREHYCSAKSRYVLVVIRPLLS